MTKRQHVADLFQRLLPAERLQEVKFIVEQRMYYLKSRATTLLRRQQLPVAIVLDAETLSAELIRERRQSLNELLEVLGGRTPSRIIFAVPEIEAIFFQEPRLLERIVGRKIPPVLRVMAQAQPRAALNELFRKSETVSTYEKLLKSLTAQDVEVLRKSPVVQELSEFLGLARDWVEGKTKTAIRV
jgi:hypothetical protein